MAQYDITTWKIDRIEHGCETSQIDFKATPSKTVDVANMGELKREFDAFVQSLEGCGTCYRVYARKNRAERKSKFRGFDAETQRGGSLHAYVNREVAIAAGRAAEPALA